MMVVDNSIDEAMAGYCDTIKVTLTNRGSAIIEDHGRGIPVAEHPTEDDIGSYRCYDCSTC